MTISRQVITAVTARAPFFPRTRGRLSPGSRTNWLKLLEEPRRGRRNARGSLADAQPCSIDPASSRSCSLCASLTRSAIRPTENLQSPLARAPPPREDRKQSLARLLHHRGGSPTLSFSLARWEETLHEPIGDNQSPSGTSPRRVGSGVGRRSRG